MIKNWKFWLGLAISAGALYLTLRGVHFDEFAATLANAQILWLIPSFLALLVTLTLRTMRWSSLMGGTPFWVTFHALNVGYMLNSILPFRLGEIGRAYVIGERTTVRMTRALSTVIVERIIDLATIVLMFVVFAQFIPMPAQFSTAALTGAIVVIFVLLASIVAIWQAALVEKALVSLEHRIPRLNSDAVIQRFRDIVHGFDVIRSPGKLALTLALTVGVWGSSLFVAFFVMLCFASARLDQLGFMIVLSNLGGAIPSAPGGLGVVQFFAKQALVIPFRISDDIAVAFAFVWSLSQQLALIALGFFGLFQVGMTFTSVTTKSQKMDTQTPSVETGK